MNWENAKEEMIESVDKSLREQFRRDINGININVGHVLSDAIPLGVYDEFIDESKIL